MSSAALTHFLLEACGVRHGFGVRGASEPERVVRPRQVHGTQVARANPRTGAEPADADAIVSGVPGLCVGVVTADCVPILLADERGGVVAAVHAGWRGLAEGVVPRAVEALRAQVGPRESLRAAVGPCIGPCCYEIDEPVVRALNTRLSAELGGTLLPASPGHWRLDLAALVRVELTRAGLDPFAIGTLESACTRCDPVRFHSYRRDGARAGRLLHWIAAAEGQA